MDSSSLPIIVFLIIVFILLFGPKLYSKVSGKTSSFYTPRISQGVRPTSASVSRNYIERDTDYY